MLHTGGDVMHAQFSRTSGTKHERVYDVSMHTTSEAAPSRTVVRPTALAGTCSSTDGLDNSRTRSDVGEETLLALTPSTQSRDQSRHVLALMKENSPTSRLQRRRIKPVLASLCRLIRQPKYRYGQSGCSGTNIRPR